MWISRKWNKHITEQSCLTPLCWAVDISAATRLPNPKIGQNSNSEPDWLQKHVNIMQGIKLNKLNKTKSNITMAGQTNNNLASHLAHPTTKFPTGTHWTCLSFLATSLIMIASSDCATRRVSCIKTPLITPMHAKPMVTCQTLQKVHVCIWCLKTGLKSAHVTARLCAFSLVWYGAIVSMRILGPFCLPVQIVGGFKYATWRLISFKASAYFTHIINKCAIHWPLLLYDKGTQNNTNEK